MKSIYMLAIAFSSVAFAQKKTLTQDEYISLFSKKAQSEQSTSNIPASITLAQGLLESGNGNSDLATKANNHFGIKCHGWTGESITMDDDAKNECFRKYDNAELSYTDHSEFLTKNKRYSSLFKLPKDDYKAWAEGLKAAGYATNPKYASLLIELIEKKKLYQFDQTSGAEIAGTIALNTAVKESKPQIDIASYYINTHTVLKNKNEVKYLVAKKGDTYYKIAQEFELGMWQLYKYNDFSDKKDLLMEGDIIYIAPKVSKAKEKGAIYEVKKDITLTEISQIEGIKLESLLKLNEMTDANTVIKKGQKILLR